MDNLYIIMVQKDGCTEQDICSFDSLKFKHKVIFTVKEYPQYRSAYYIPKSEVDIQNVKIFVIIKVDLLENVGLMNLIGFHF